MKKILFFGLFALMISVLAFAVDFVLGSLGLGYSTEPFRKHPGDFLTINHDLLKKYNLSAGQKGQHLVEPLAIGADKDNHVIRGLILGESTAQGFPFFISQSFSAIAAKALASALGPEKRLELINWAQAATTSFTLADLAGKLGPVKPDFVVIYAGHNEYYGTITATNDLEAFFRQLNLALKESHFLQLLFSIFESGVRLDGTLMNRQFATRYFPKNEASDAQVADIFVKNVERATWQFLERGVPVIIFTPASNLIDMPPFGQDLSGAQATLLPVVQALQAGDLTVAKRLWAARGSVQPPTSALALYLQARLEEPSTSTLEVFNQAKDADPVPFRARTILIEKLKNWGRLTQPKFPNLRVIDTVEALAALPNPPSLGNQVFVDHLHFNATGQRLVGQILADNLASIWRLDQKKVDTFFQNTEAVEAAVYFSDFFDGLGQKKVLELSQQPPYSLMSLKANFGLLPAKEDGLFSVGSVIGNRLRSLPSTEWFPTYLQWFIETGDQAMQRQTLQSFWEISPGSPLSNQLLGKLFEQTGQDTKTAFDYYLRAYLLSDRQQVYADDVQRTLKQMGQSSDWPEIQRLQ